MSRQPWPFTPSAVARLIRVAERAKLRHYRIEIARGRLALVVGEQQATADSPVSQSNPWDEVLTDDTNQKRPA